MYFIGPKTLEDVTSMYIPRACAWIWAPEPNAPKLHLDMEPRTRRLCQQPRQIIFPHVNPLSLLLLPPYLDYSLVASLLSPPSRLNDSDRAVRSTHYASASEFSELLLAWGSKKD